MKFKSMLVMFVVTLMSFALVSDNVFARGGGRSSSRSSFSRPSSSRSAPAKSAPSTFSKKSAPATTQSRATAKPKLKATPAQMKSYEIAKKNGTAFKTPAEAQNAFKAKYASTYTSKYATEPAQRPAYIPQSTNVGGTTYNITYNQSSGGYGYMNTLGSFILYDMMTDSMQMNHIMAQNNYVVDSPVYHHRSSGFVLLSLCAGITLIIAVGIFVRAFC
jgi:cytoskeletal protein RodZ